MASRTELERLEARKARLIKQNDLYRRDLLAEADNLREAADLIDRGHGFYKAATRLGGSSLFSLFRSKEKSTAVAKVWEGCVAGFSKILHLKR